MNWVDDSVTSSEVWIWSSLGEYYVTDVEAVAAGATVAAVITYTAGNVASGYSS